MFDKDFNTANFTLSISILHNKYLVMLCFACLKNAVIAYLCCLYKSNKARKLIVTIWYSFISEL